MNRLERLDELGLVDLPDELVELGLNHAIVYAALESEGGAIPFRICEDYGLSPGTVYPAIWDLEDAGLITKRPSLSDPSADVCEVNGPSVVPTTA